MRFRLSLMYFCMFAFIAVHMPFWPIWLEAKGLGSSEIAVLTALAFSLKIIFTPIVSGIADRNGSRRQAVVWLALGLFAFCCVFFFTRGFAQIFVVTTLAFACWSPVMSLCESLTTVTAREKNLDYGKIRLWGSIAFMIVAAFSGQLLERIGEPVLLWSIVGTAGLIFIASLQLPKVEVKKAKASVSSRPFWRTKWFVVFIAATMLIQGSHAGYYTFASIHWRSVGISDQVIGMLWGGSMGVEVLFFAFGRPILAKLGPVNVILLGGVAAAARWLIIGSTANLALIAGAQALHALSFGASHFAAMRIITEKVDDSMSATGQGIYSAFIMGVGMGAFVLLSGPIYDALHAGVFVVMAAVSLSGVALMWFGKSLEMSRIAPDSDPEELGLQVGSPAE